MSQAAVKTEESVIPDPYSISLEEIDMGKAALYPAQAHWAYFERLRKEDPVHFCESEEFGPYWSITKFNDIVHVDTHHKQFSPNRRL